MGDWMTVKIVGTCSKADLPKLTDAVDWERDRDRDFHCLSFTGGLAGLPMWAQENIDVIGNCAERDYTPNDVAKVLGDLAKIAPSLNVKVHCGDHYESENCIATITLANGVVTIGDPEIATIGMISEKQMHDNLMRLMGMANQAGGF